MPAKRVRRDERAVRRGERATTAECVDARGARGILPRLRSQRVYIQQIIEYAMRN